MGSHRRFHLVYQISSLFRECNVCIRKPGRHGLRCLFSQRLIHNPDAYMACFAWQRVILVVWIEAHPLLPISSRISDICCCLQDHHDGMSCNMSLSLRSCAGRPVSRRCFETQSITKVNPGFLHGEASKQAASHLPYHGIKPIIHQEQKHIICLWPFKSHRLSPFDLL